MSFANWKKRSKRYHDMMAGHGIGRADAEEVAQAAYKAGERNGRKQAEASAGNAIGLAVLAERELCANICDHEQGTAGDAADKIRMRFNEKFQGAAVGRPDGNESCAERIEDDTGRVCCRICRGSNA